MKIDSKRLKQIIKEEIHNLHEEEGDLDLSGPQELSTDRAEQDLESVVEDIKAQIETFTADMGEGAFQLYKTILMNKLKGMTNK
jgi:Glu-tRNA(Gln) amidotransferase subunit E-like FAD-binding protein